MRKFGLLAMLTLAATLTFSAVVLADPTPAPGYTDPASQGISTNATGYNTEDKTTTAKDGSTVDFTGQSYRMTPDQSFTGGNGGAGFESPVPSSDSIKYDSPNNQVIHSAYSKTSDACASCHAVHTAVNGMLLQWEDPQTACWACHDGTVDSTYDVVNGTHNGVYSSAGLFGTGSEAATEGLSNHGMSPKEAAFVTTAAAPGGAEVATVIKDGKEVANVDKNGNWDTEFTCIACHDPHGTYGNARILNPDVNGIATKTLADLTTAKGEVTTTTDNLNYKTSKDNWMSGRNNEPIVYVNGEVAGDAKKFTDYSVDYKAGTVTFKTAQTGKEVKIAYKPAMVVEMKIDKKLTADETVKYENGINQFCGACHTDYNNVGKTEGANGVGGAYDELLGNYRKAYRHSVGFTRTANAADLGFNDPNSLNASYPGLKFDTSNPKTPGIVAATVDCLTCHYAHGTSDAFIEGSLDQLGQIDAFMGPNKDGKTINGDKILQTYDSSRTTALKRLPNMGVCQVCHNKTGLAPESTGPAIVVAQVSTEDSLKAALADSTKTNIRLTKSFTVTTAVNVTRPVTIEGNGLTLTLDNKAADTPATSLGLYLGAGTVVKNLAITTTTTTLNDNLVEVYGGNVYFENVTIKGSKKAGMLVGDNAKVIVRGKLTLTDNAWGGIEVKNSSNTNITFAQGSSLSYTAASSKTTAPVVWVDADVFANSGSFVIDTADVLADPTLETSNGSQVWWQKK